MLKKYKESVIICFLFLVLNNQLKKISYSSVEEGLQMTHFWMEKIFDTMIYWILKFSGGLTVLSYSGLNLFVVGCGLSSAYTLANFVYSFPWYYGKWALNLSSNSIQYVPAIGMAKALLRVSSLEAYFAAYPLPPSLWIDGLGLPWFKMKEPDIHFERYLKIEEVMKYRDEIKNFFQNQSQSLQEVMVKIAQLKDEKNRSSNLRPLLEEKRYETLVESLFDSNNPSFVSIPPNLPLTMKKRIFLEEERGEILGIAIKNPEEPIVRINLEGRQNLYTLEEFLSLYPMLPPDFLDFLQRSFDKEFFLQKLGPNLLICPEYVSHLLNLSEEGALIVESCKQIKEISYLFGEWLNQKLMESEEKYTPEIVQKVLDYLPRPQIPDSLPTPADSPKNSDWWKIVLTIGSLSCLGLLVYYGSNIGIDSDWSQFFKTS